MLLQVKSLPSNLPSAFIDEPEAPDQDDIPTVKMLLELPGDEPTPELLARAEPIAPPLAVSLESSVDPDPNERMTFTFVRDPVPAPDFKARLIEIHRRAGFLTRLTLPSSGPVSIGLLLTMVMPHLCAGGAIHSTQPLQAWWIVEQQQILSGRA